MGERRREGGGGQYAIVPTCLRAFSTPATFVDPFLPSRSSRPRVGAFYPRVSGERAPRDECERCLRGALMASTQEYPRDQIGLSAPFRNAPRLLRPLNACLENRAPPLVILFEFRGSFGIAVRVLQLSRLLCYYHYLKLVEKFNPPESKIFNVKYSLFSIFKILVFTINFRYTAICFKFMRVRVNRCYITITQRTDRARESVHCLALAIRRLDRRSRIKKTDSIANSRYTLYSEML